MIIFTVIFITDQRYQPSVSSVLRIMGMLIVLAALTATNGTSLPTRGGSVLTRAFRPKAVPRAPPVAATYEEMSVL
jgi:hypothetical protein